MPSITVTWDSNNNRPTAPNTTVRGNSAKTITWVPDGVTITGITTPSGPASDFTAPAKAGNSNNWQCTDSLSANGSYTYTITGTHISGGPPASHDPKITNDRGGN